MAMEGLTYFCPMCAWAHGDWGTLVDIEAYYIAVGIRPAPPIMQCQRCYFRIPLARIRTGPQDGAEADTTTQEYAQISMF